MGLLAQETTRDVGRTLEKLVNHEPPGINLQDKCFK